MPPPRKRARGDALDEIARKLSEKTTISKTVLEKVREQVRILEARLPTGRLPGKQDRHETRMAALLEWVYRKDAGKRLAWKDLAAAVGCKVASLEQLQQAAVNILATPRAMNNTTINRIQNRGTIEKKPIPRLNGNNSLLDSSLFSRKRPISRQSKTPPASNSLLRRSTRTTTVINASSSAATTTSTTQQTVPAANHERLAALSIRLAVHLSDPLGACRAAAKLLQNVRDCILHQYSTSERRGLLYDLQRYQPAYEAAALYVVSRQPQMQAEEGRTNIIEPNERAKPLDVHQLVDASTAFTYLELKQVLPHVQEMAQKLESSSSTTVNVQMKPRNAAGIVHQDDKTDTDDSRLLLASNVDLTKDEGDDDNKSFDLDEDDETFRLWQETVVSDACESARKELPGIEDESILLEHAAKSVLMKYGITLPTDNSKAAASNDPAEE